MNETRRSRTAIAWCPLVLSACVTLAAWSGAAPPADPTPGVLPLTSASPGTTAQPLSLVRVPPVADHLPSDEWSTPVASPTSAPTPSSAPSPYPRGNDGLSPWIGLAKPLFAYRGPAAWQIQTPSSSTSYTYGYASAPSYLPGDTLRVAVSTTAPRYDVAIFRLSGSAPVESPFELVAAVNRLAGRVQGATTVDARTRMVRVRWSWTFEFQLPGDWRSGIYLARLAGSGGAQSYVPFVVRSQRASRYLVVSNALTWQAYNTWGGSSLYSSSVGQPLAGVSRALAVSFDRPYLGDGGAGQLFTLELPLIHWLERYAHDVTYTTDYDLSVNPAGQPLPRAILFNGHSEYWSVALRRWLDKHVVDRSDFGLGVFAADSGYWPVGLTEPSDTGPRVVVCFKQLIPGLKVGTPIGEGNNGQTLFRSYPDGQSPGSLPEQAIFGEEYDFIPTKLVNLRLTDAAPGSGLLEGTGLAANSSLGYIAGGEVDYVHPDQWGPLGHGYDHIFAEARGFPTRYGVPGIAQVVYRSLPNGAHVFSAGTFYWGWALDPRYAQDRLVAPGFGQLTVNILAFLVVQPSHTRGG